MDAGVVGGAFLSATLQVLFDRMASKEFLDFVQGKKLDHKLLMKLRVKLISAKAVLDDAEVKQIGNSAVKQWLDELNEAIYDAEDLMAEINNEILRYKLKDESGSSLKKVPNFIRAKFSAFNRGVEKKILWIIDKLNIILEQKEVLGLKEGVGLGYRPPGRLPATSLVEASDVLGRNVEKEYIIDLLLRNNDIGNYISVIPIVGMAGIGKTTLAQLIFNDERVKERFHFKEWIFVSYQFDVLRMTKEILLTISGQTFTNQDLNLHQVKLWEALKDKRFLLVLDDVWNNDIFLWDEFKKPFKSAAYGSSIIVTTRSEGLASAMCNGQSYKLQKLSENDSWELFVKHAFNNGNPCVHPKIESIRRQIVQRCNGLPLAVKSLGILLSHQSKPEEWDKILNNDMWELPIDNNNILPSLWLSYHHLPSHLKRCFAYCSIFPKDYDINKGDLVNLWIAEDLLQSQKNKSIEEIGEEYIDSLLSRSLLQQSLSLDGSSTLTMHELMNDLATYITREFCLRLDDNSNANKLPNKVRHVSQVNARDYDLEKHKPLLRRIPLRTFLSSSNFEDKELQNLVIAKWLPTLTCLRVLSLSEYSITKLPASIGKLKLLRYLDLSSTKIEKLPATVCTLNNLHTLLLRDCEDLKLLPTDIGELKLLRYLDLSRTKIKELPATICTLNSLHTLLLRECDYLKLLPMEIGKLINLHHLDIAFTCLEKMPLEIGDLKVLQTLTDFVLGQDSGYTIKSLRDLQHLHGSLRIAGLENVVDDGDVLEANLKDKKHLTELHFLWSYGIDTDDECNPQKDREILSGLQPHTNIKLLHIGYYSGERFPDWMGDHSFSNMEKIHLNRCMKCCQLPPFGQLPFLKQLEIMDFGELVKVGDEFYRGDCPVTSEPFRCLELLSFRYMPKWQEWSFPGGDMGGAFPKLKALILVDCPILRITPLNSIESVHITGCHSWVL